MNYKNWRKELAEYGNLHNEDCCVNNENNGCDVDVKDSECCENIRLSSAFAEELIKCLTEYFSHDMKFENEEQRKAAVKMYIEELINPS